MKPIRIAITTGDIDGIGTEVTAKALQKIKPMKGIYFYLWRSPRCPKKHLSFIDSQFKRTTVDNWPQALRTSHTSYKEIIDIESNLSPAHWVEASAEAGYFGHIDGLVTAPISKTLIKSVGFQDIGHTEILKRVTQSDYVFMTFLGNKMNVLIATGHIPLNKISDQITSKTIEEALLAAHRLKVILPTKIAKRPIALVGMNPHAGEDGLLGDDERNLFAPALARVEKLGISCVGPLVPDVAFQPTFWTKYSVYVCPYHDQALIPFKMVHGHHSGVHITSGLPFVRTSVDHGTAKDLFNKNKANPGSMIEAIRLNIELCRNSNQTQSFTVKS